MFKLLSETYAYIFCDLCKKQIENIEHAEVFYAPKIASNLEVFPINSFSGIAIAHGGDCSEQIQEVFWMLGIRGEPINLPLFLIALLHQGGMGQEQVLQIWQEFFSYPPIPAKDIRSS